MDYSQLFSKCEKYKDTCYGNMLLSTLHRYFDVDKRTENSDKLPNRVGVFYLLDDDSQEEGFVVYEVYVITTEGVFEESFPIALPRQNFTIRIMAGYVKNIRTMTLYSKYLYHAR